MLLPTRKEMKGRMVCMLHDEILHTCAGSYYLLVPHKSFAGILSVDGQTDVTVFLLQVISATESNSLGYCCIILWLQLQLDPFRSVGILGFNSPEWHISNLAAIFAGYVLSVRLLHFVSLVFNSEFLHKLIQCL